MADFESIIKNHAGEDGSIPAEAIAKLTKAISTTVGNEFVEKPRYKAKLEEIDTLKGEKQTAEDSAATAEKWKNKYETAKKELDDYKAEQTRKETRAAKEKAVRAYLESKNIKGGNLTIAMRGLGAEIDAAELDGDKLKDTKALDDLIAGDLSGLVTTTTERGAPPPANPPRNTGGAMTKEQIMAIQDRTERRAAIAANMDAFKKGD